MRFVQGPPPPSRTLDPVAAGWSPLRDGRSRSDAILAIAWVCLFLIPAIAAFLKAAPTLRRMFHQKIWSLPCFLVLLLALVPLHELIHAVAYGRGLRSPHLIAGMWPVRGLAYVLYDGPLPRNRVLWMLSAPFLLLTFLPSLGIGFLTGPWLVLLLFFCVLHTSLCAGDALTILRLLKQTPRGALIHNQGWTTYWSPQ